MKKQRIIGLLILVMSLAIAFTSPEIGVTVRILLGLALGYVLVRGAFGFAGSINRAMRFNSLKLMRALMLMFVITSFGVAIIYGAMGVENFMPWINKINAGLIIGGILFGFGMAFSSCCASGAMTDGVVNPSKLLVVTLGFGTGILLGFPLQNNATWVKDGATVALYSFSSNPIVGLVIALVITCALALLVVKITYMIEKKWADEGKVSSCKSEELSGEYNTTVEKVFEKPYSLTTAAILISIIFLIMILLTKNGWGASTPYGFWVGKGLIALGMDPQTLGQFTGQGAEFFQTKLFSGQGPSSVGIQNVFIFVGGVVAALTMNTYAPSFKLSGKEVAFFLLGGIVMGFGTRLANGCNVGALYTPIANFSLSGWIFLVVMTIGGILGNIVYKKLN